MTLEKSSIPQIHVVDIEAEASEIEFDDVPLTSTRRRRCDGRIGVWRAVLLVLASVILTSTTMLMAIPQTRQVVVHKEIMGTSLHSIVARGVRYTKSRTTKSNKKASTAIPKPRVLFPLYMWPGENAVYWQPAINAAKNNPNVQFLMIVNPNNGPGGKTVDLALKAGLKALAGLANVKLIGYIHQSYGSRAFNAIQKDLNMWATYKNANMYGVKIQGIFYDEMPDDNENKGAHVKYVGKANALAHNVADFTTIVQNPGTIPDPAYFKLSGNQAHDVTIILEEQYNTYLDDPTAYSIGQDVSKLSIMLNSIPASFNTAAKYATFIAQLKAQATYIWLSDLTVDFYEGFGANWNNFIGGIAANQS